MGSLAVSMFIFAGIFVYLESNELLDDRRCFQRQDKNDTWPKDECNSISIGGFHCDKVDKICYYTITINNTLLPENASMNLSRTQLDSPCKCNCDCNCTDSPGEDRLIYNIEKVNYDFIQDRMDPGCYRFYTPEHNIRSCCVYFPGYDHMYVGDMNEILDTVKEDTDDKKSVSNHSDENWIYWGIGSAVVLLLGLLIALPFVLKQKGFTLHRHVELSSSPSRDIPPPTAGNRKDFLLIYENQSHNQIRNILNQLVKDIENVVNCKVHDYKGSGDLLDHGVYNFLHRVVPEFDKVIVLLSPEVSSDAESPNQDIYCMFSYHFFTEYLRHNQSNNKIIYVSLEQFPCSVFKFCNPSVVYALPTKLEDFLQRLH